MNDSYIGAPEDRRGYWEDKDMPEDESRYGLKLVSNGRGMCDGGRYHDGQDFDMWVVGSDQSRLELTADEINDALIAYQTRNPRGEYRIEQIR